MKDIEKNITSEDITDIKLTDAQYHWGAGYGKKECMYGRL